MSYRSISLRFFYVKHSVDNARPQHGRTITAATATATSFFSYCCADIRQQNTSHCTIRNINNNSNNNIEHEHSNEKVNDAKIDKENGKRNRISRRCYLNIIESVMNIICVYVWMYGVSGSQNTTLWWRSTTMMIAAMR